MVGIAPGSMINFTKNPKRTYTVIDNKYNDFEGERTSLSASALKIVNGLGYTWNAIAGPDYWVHEGEALTAKRLRLEEEDVD